MAMEIGGGRGTPTPRRTQPSPTPQVPSTRVPRAGSTAPTTPTPSQPSPNYGSSAPALTNLIPLGGGGGGEGGSPTPGGGGGGGEGWGTFGNYDQWAAQFQAEHGRTPNEQDVYDFVDSQNFVAMTGRSPTQEEWLTRYYTGSWFGGGGGGWGGGGGGWGGGYGQQQQSPFTWNPNLTFWNIR